MLKKIIKWLLILLLLFFVGCVVVYFMIKSGRLSLMGLSQMLVSKGDIVIVNVTDGELRADLDATDPDAEASFSAIELASFETGGFGSVPKGTYTLELGAGETCTLDIKRGDEYTFVAVPRGIAVSRKGFEAKSADDLDMSTSSLCQ